MHWRPTPKAAGASTPFWWRWLAAGCWYRWSPSAPTPAAPADANEGLAAPPDRSALRQVHLERVLLRNIIRLRDLSASDVMVPRVDITAVPEDISRDALRYKMKKFGLIHTDDEPAAPAE